MLQHVFGFIGLAFIVGAWQFNNRNKILLLNVLAFIFFAAELYLLDATIGALMMIAAATNAALAIYTQHRFLMVALIAIPLLLALPQASHWYDAMPIIAHMTGTITFFSKRVRRMRFLAPIGTILWGIHNITVGAWGQFLADLFILSSMIVGALRHQKDSA